MAETTEFSNTEITEVTELRLVAPAFGLAQRASHQHLSVSVASAASELINP